MSGTENKDCGWRVGGATIEKQKKADNILLMISPLLSDCRRVSFHFQGVEMGVHKLEIHMYVAGKG